MATQRNTMGVVDMVFGERGRAGGKEGQAQMDVYIFFISA